MPAQSQKNSPASANGKKIAATPKSDTSKELVKLTLPEETRETAENFIVPAGPLGKERWFIKAKMAKTEMVAGRVVLHLTRGEVASRGLGDHITA